MKANQLFSVLFLALSLSFTCLATAFLFFFPLIVAADELMLTDKCIYVLIVFILFVVSSFMFHLFLHSYNLIKSKE